MKSPDDRYRGMKIQTLSRVGTVVGCCLLIVIICVLHSIIGRYKNLIDNVTLFTNSQVVIQELDSVSDYMTEQVRLYVITGESAYADNYFGAVDNELREKAFNSLKDFLGDEHYSDSVKAVEDALTASNALMEYELHAMKLVAINSGTVDSLPQLARDYEIPLSEMELSEAERLEVAYHLVYGKEYRDDKERIDKDTADATDTLSDEMELNAVNSANDLKRSINRLSVSIFLLFLLLIIVFIAIAVFIVHPIKVMVKCIEEDRAFDIIGAYEFKYLAVTYNNIFEINRENKARMKYELDHDSLTGLFNRHAFDERKELLSQVEGPMGIIMLDLDYFKEINDKYGHDGGDAALKRAADTMRGYFRTKDIVARFGGDEFVVLLPNVTPEDSEMLGRKIDHINHSLGNPVNGEMALSVSAGIAFSEKGYTEQLFGKADAALYEAKEAGRCCYRICE